MADATPPPRRRDQQRERAAASSRSARRRQILALASAGDWAEAARLAAEDHWLDNRALDQLLREQPFGRGWAV